jgi:4-coumarate--CoA ligase
MPKEHWDTKAGSIGPLLPNLEARLVSDDGTDAPTGGRGEIWLRGPSIMKVRGRLALEITNSIANRDTCAMIPPHSTV